MGVRGRGWGQQGVDGGKREWMGVRGSMWWVRGSGVGGGMREGG